jgi:UDP-galactopyranose mutase
MLVDYLIVGSGLTGATIARTLADQGREVLVLERRRHLGGNMHDQVHESGIRIHTYGPHYFRTSSERIWRFVRRFGDFHRFEAILMSHVDGRLEHWPIQAEYIERTIGPDWRPAHCGPAANFEEASLAMMPQAIYTKFVRGYTAKQWGVDPKTLAAELAGRFDVRRDGDARLKSSTHQGVPTAGYSELMRRMLDGIRVVGEVDYLKARSQFTARKLVVFTGPVDEYFGFDLGKLAYRGQRRRHEFLPQMAWHQPVPQVNYPDPAVPHVRILEWKHMMEPRSAAGIAGTVLTWETPYSPADPSHYEYPFPDESNRRLYLKYRERAEADPRLLVCGRLGEFRYFDMDQAIGRALMIAERILRGDEAPRLSAVEAE